MTLQPCLICGEPCSGPRCLDHALTDTRTAARRPDEHTYSWTVLSRSARKLQPFCLVCHSTARLQADHSPRAWARQERGLSLRLCDVTVLCGRCNAQAGSSQPGTDRYRQWEHEDGDLRAKTPDQTLRVGLTARGGAPFEVASSATQGSKFASHIGLSR